MTPTIPLSEQTDNSVVTELYYLNDMGETQTMTFTADEVSSFMTKVINRFPIGFELMLQKAIDNSDHPDRNKESIIHWLKISSI